MNVIAMPETAVEAISAEAVTVETEAAGPATSLIPDTRQIPLSKLTASKKNVRKKSAAMTIPELASSIEAHGLIQNLTVRKAAKGNKYEVIAGSRRFAALTLLAKQGRIDKSALVPCNVRSGDDNDTEISLAENTQREAMSLVEEILGYRQLVKDGMTPETIAARFGQSIVTVRQRLKLAHLSPRILDELSEDAISLDQAKALAISDDHAAQESAWFDHRHGTGHPTAFAPC
ncbi:ParB/RepB/Spo0J family partition protein [Sinorhizobium meliloti]|nr:ParB/RepB/Spo0J family partition protein [Sinorhizobium meliloti]